MDPTAAQQHHLNTMATHHMLTGLSDNPQQFREPPLIGPFRQAYRAWQHQNSQPMNYDTVPF